MLHMKEMWIRTILMQKFKILYTFQMEKRETRLITLKSNKKIDALK